MVTPAKLWISCLENSPTVRCGSEWVGCGRMSVIFWGSGTEQKLKDVRKFIAAAKPQPWHEGTDDALNPRTKGQALKFSQGPVIFAHLSKGEVSKIAGVGHAGGRKGCAEYMEIRWTRKFCSRDRKTKDIRSTCGCASGRRLTLKGKASNYRSISSPTVLQRCTVRQELCSGVISTFKFSR